MSDGDMAGLWRWRVMAEIPVRDRDRVQTCPFVLQPIINNTRHVTQICLIRCITSFLRLSSIYIYLMCMCACACVFLYNTISNEIRANKFVCNGHSLGWPV